MARELTQSNNYRLTITSDGTDSGTLVGSMSATVDSGNRSISITSVLTGSTLPADSVIQAQFTDFITQVRAQASAAGLTPFATAG